MKPDPLVSIGQGDNAREITENDATRGTPWLGLFSLWLAFAVVAWLVSLAKRH